MSVDPTRGWLDRIATHAGREAIRFGEAAIDYAALASHARLLGARLEDFGTRPGELVAVSAPPSVEGAALVHAMLDGGVVSLPLNARLSDRERVELLRRSRARFLVVARGPDEARSIDVAKAAGCGVLGLVPVSRGRSTPDLSRLCDPEDVDPTERDRRCARLRADAAAVVLYTSGTSGRSKGVVLGLDQLMASAEASGRLLGANAHDRWLLCMPLFHIGGLSILIRSALAGSAVVLHERFDARRVASALDAERITRVSFVATMLEQVIAARGARPAPRALELVLLGGGPASPSLLARAVAAGYPIAPTYGLTEAASQVATRPPGATPAAQNTDADLAAGLQPLPGVSIRVVDAEGESVSASGEGEIQVRGPIVMRSILDDPVATRKAFVDGWLATGDIGRLDAEGRLRVLDRRVDLIVSGGENVYPAEIEAVLVEHGDVEEAGVVGVPDPVYGARPLAFVVLRAGARFDAESLLAFCRERLAGYKVPDAIEPIDALPRTPTGKLLRRVLSARLPTA